MILTLIYTILLGLWAYVLASNSELSLLPPKEMVFEMLKAAIAVGLFICLIIGADSISGDRERATLEGLLLTPTSRRQLVFGKYLAAISPWPACFIIIIPYWYVMSQGDEVFAQTIFWGGIMGTILALALAGIGMIVSFWSNSNRTSMFISLGLYLFLFLPTQLPGRAQTGFAGALLQQVNPLAAATHFNAKMLVNNSTWSVMWPWFVSPLALAALVVGILVVTAGSLQLESNGLRRIRLGRSNVVALVVLAGLMASMLVHPRLTFAMVQPQGAQSLEVAIDVDARTVNAGDPVLYNTTVTNNGAETSPRLTLAMNIINLDAKGGVVDPEDWSPERTQYLEPLAPGASSSQSWRVNSILDGDYMVYMVLIPAPSAADATTRPVASPGIHLTVMPFHRLNPGGVLPYVIGGPLLIGLTILLVYRRRQQSIDTGIRGETTGTY